MKKIITILSILFVLNNAKSQVTQEWAARYNGPPGNNSDFASAMALDGSGNVYVTGYSAGNATGSYDYATVKYNSSGVQQWVSRYNGTANGTDYAYAIAVDNSGNVYVTGGSVGIETNYYMYATVKYNASGVQQWVAIYDLGGGSIARSIAVDASENVYVTGESAGMGTYNDYTTIKYNSSGILQWLSRYNGPTNGTDEASSMFLDASGNVYVTGLSHNNITFYSEYATVKYNSSGIQQWASVYNGPGNGSDVAKSIAADASGNVYVTGYSEGIGSNADYATIKYNSAGDSVWVKRYNGPGNAFDAANSLAIDALGNVYVTGYSSQFVANFDYATIKYNSVGDSLWVKRYNGSSNYRDYANSLALDGSGNVYITGYSRETIGSDNYTTIKYNSSGVQQWLASYSAGTNGEEARSIAVDGSGNVFVTGYSATATTLWDYATVKYSQTGSSLTLNLTTFIQGFYNSTSNNMTGDTVKVNLRNAAFPYNIIDSTKTKLSSSGTGALLFANAVNNVNYYLEVKHRNSIKTWSGSTINFIAGSVTYNFSTVQTQAYGNNEIQVDLSPLRYAVYSGDVNQDDIIDASDMSAVENDAGLSVSGYVSTDVTGDDFVDAGDVSLVENNVALGVSVVTP